ncbi:hypothetical protein [Bdellovibrio sp. HCB209]|uniref:hypothetical protein n=1 Tax=Bdellovibrio sp. HCB209 TaxID=3394354 RepID=UPI0039B62DE6
MKNLILTIALLGSSSLAFASGGVTIHNNTHFTTKLVIKQGDLIVSQTMLRSSTTTIGELNDYYRVNATAIINGEKVSTEAVLMDGLADFTAALQENPDNSVAFGMEESLRSNVDSIAFTNTLTTPVQFTIFGTDSPDGGGARVLQTVVLPSASTSNLKITAPSEGYQAYAVINGITTPAIKIQGYGSTVTIEPTNDSAHPGTFKVVGEDIDLST